MSDRIKEIRNRFTAALQAAKAQRDRQSQGFIIPCMEHAEAIRKWEVHIPADLEFLLAEVGRLQSRAVPEFAWEPAGEDRFTSAVGIVKGRVFTFEDEWHWEVSTSSVGMRTVYAESISEDRPWRQTKEDAMRRCEAAMLATIGIGGKK